MIYKRNKLLYVFITLIIMILGLCSRKFSYILPHFLSEYLGDTLWALMIFFGFSFVLSSLKTKKVALVSLCFCYTIELSQMYHASWIDSIRRTTLGGLILGFGFLWSDILCYTVGIGIGIIIDVLICSRNS